MANFFDYLDWRGDLTFAADKLNRVDCCLFSQFVLLDFDDIVPLYVKNNQESSLHFTLLKDALKKYIELKRQNNDLGLIVPNTIIDSFIKAGNTNRFKDVELSNYINIVDEKREEQFCAITIRVDKDLSVIVFSGTDDTVIGWKENFNMIFSSPVPAQITCVNYIEDVIKNNEGKFIVCGHSKGGNLALYGGTHVNKDTQKRIVTIYNFDGPGISNMNSEYINQIHGLGKVVTIIPQTSMVGRLFDHNEKCEIVKSTMKSLYQHDAFSWEILGSDFISEKELTSDSEVIDKKIKEILFEMTEEEKKKFVSGLYTVMTAANCKSLLELSNHKKDMLSAYFKMDKDDRKYLSVPIKKLLKVPTIQLYLIKGIREATKVNK